MMYRGQKTTTRAVAMALVVLGLTAAAVESAQAEDEETIFEIMLKTDGAQALVAAVLLAEEAGCLDLLPARFADRDFNAVVFAPSNNAFERFLRLDTNALAGPGADKIDEIKAQLPELLRNVELTEADLCDVLSNHVGEVGLKAEGPSAADLLAKGSITVRNGKTFPISVGSGGVRVNYETHIKKEIVAVNGIIHFVEDVIQDPPPPSDNVVTIFTAGSSGGFRGDFNGNPRLAGADATCQNHADTSGLGGTSWTAWLSDSTTDAIDRVPDGEYRLVDGTLVANAKADLSDGMLKHQLNQSQYGSELNILAWTGTGPDGRSTGSNCSDWTKALRTTCSGDPADPDCGTQGNSANTDSSWTDIGFRQNCGSAAGLYCFGILE